MPDCSKPDLGKLYAKLAALSIEKKNMTLDALGSFFGSSLSDLTGSSDLDESLLNTLGDMAEAFTQNLVSSMASNISEYAAQKGIANFGTILATILSSGQTAYLALSAFLLTLLRYELQRRMTVSNLLIIDLRRMSQLLTILLNSPAGLNPGLSLSNLAIAYKHITRATVAIGETKDKLENLRLFNIDNVNTADSELEQAKTIMYTPIADAIQKIIRDARLFDGDIETAANFVKDPTDMITDWNDKELFSEEKQKKQKASSEEQFDTLMNGILEYLGLPGGPEAVFSEIKSVTIKLAKNLATYVPMDPRKLFQVTSALYSSDFSKILDTNKPGYINLDNLASTVRDLTPLMKNRTLYNLNYTIEQKISWLSIFKESWPGLNFLTATTLPALVAVFNLLVALRDDIEPYTNKPASGLNIKVKGIKAIGTQAALSIKMSVWKSKITAIRRNLKTLKTYGQQIYDVGTSYALLDNIILELQRTKRAYNDEDPEEGEVAYILEADVAYEELIKILDTIWDSLTDSGKLRQIDNSIREAALSLENSVYQDRALATKIKGFSNSVLSIQGINGIIKTYQTVLDPNKQSNAVLQELVKQVRDGNLEILINASMASIGELTAAGEKTIDIITAIPEAIEVVADLGLALGRGVYECFSTFLKKGTEGQKRVKKDILKAQDKEKQKTEFFDTSNNEINRKTKETEDTISYMTEDPVDNTVTPEGLKGWKEAINNTLKSPVTIEQLIGNIEP